LIEPVVLNKAFITYVWPIFEYCRCVWLPHIASDVNEIKWWHCWYRKHIKFLSGMSYSEGLSCLGLECLQVTWLKGGILLYCKTVHINCHT